MKHIKKYKEYLNQNFWNWFGESKVVDENGNPLVVYHGTNTDFPSFDFKKNRTVLNDEFQGDGLFFSPDPDVAEAYAEASRNQFINKDKIFKVLDDKYPKIIAKLFKDVVNLGYQKGWDVNVHDNWDDVGKEFWEEIKKWEVETGLNINELMDFAEWVEYAKQDPDPFDGIGMSGSLFGNNGTYLPEWIKEESKKYGFQDILPTPNIIPVYLKIEKLLTTDNREEAKNARKNGYDGVYYTGGGLVDDVPEYIVYEPTQIKSAIGNNGKFDLNNKKINEKLITTINEYRQQLEIPFDGKHPLHDKPLHVHILDALSDMDKENGVKEENYYSDWTSSDISNAWISNTNNAYEEYKQHMLTSDNTDINYEFLNMYDPIDNEEYFNEEINNYITENDLEKYTHNNVINIIENFDLYYELDLYLSNEGRKVLEDEIIPYMFDKYQDEYNCQYILEQNMTDDGLVPLYRAINYDKGDKKDTYENIINHSNVGIFWSFEHDGAIPHGGGIGKTMILTALIKPEYINWEHTIYKSAWDLREEKEVEVNEDVDIKIIAIEYANGDGELKLPKNFIVKT